MSAQTNIAEKAMMSFGEALKSVPNEKIVSDALVGSGVGVAANFGNNVINDDHGGYLGAAAVGAAAGGMYKAAAKYAGKENFLGDLRKSFTEKTANGTNVKVGSQSKATKPEEHILYANTFTGREASENVYNKNIGDLDSKIADFTSQGRHTEAEDLVHKRSQLINRRDTLRGKEFNNTSDSAIRARMARDPDLSYEDAKMQYHGSRFNAPKPSGPFQTQDSANALYGGAFKQHVNKLKKYDPETYTKLMNNAHEEANQMNYMHDWDSAIKEDTSRAWDAAIKEDKERTRAQYAARKEAKKQRSRDADKAREHFENERALRAPHQHMKDGKGGMIPSDQSIQDAKFRARQRLNAKQQQTVLDQDAKQKQAASELLGRRDQRNQARFKSNIADLMGVDRSKNTTPLGASFSPPLLNPANVTIPKSGIIGDVSEAGNLNSGGKWTKANGGREAMDASAVKSVLKGWKDREIATNLSSVINANKGPLEKVSFNSINEMLGM